MNQSLNEIFAAIPKEQILVDQKQIRKIYGQNTMSLDVEIDAVIYANNLAEVRSVVIAANDNKIPIYPISTGNNWGYGCATPATSNCIILDLSRMNLITDFDINCGVVTLQPGVTQSILYDYLKNNNLDYMVPTTGAGPDCSILGNILERGYGLAPISDHVQSLNSVQAVLADGAVYDGSFPADKKSTDRSCPWGIGPLITQLFTQSNYTVITEASVRLIPRSEKCGLVVIPLAQQEIPEEVYQCIIDVQHAVGVSHMSPITIMHGDRFAKFSASDNMRSAYIDKRAAKYFGTKKWLMFFSIFGNKHIIKAVRRTVREAFLPNRCIYISTGFDIFSGKALERVNYFNSNTIKKFLGFANTAITAFSGIPTSNGLAFIYQNRDIAAGVNPNPSIDGCGVMWFSPIVPLYEMGNYFDFVSETMREYSRDVCVSFTTLVPGMVLASVPILYDKVSSSDYLMAKKCYETLLERSIIDGYHPYRLGVATMPGKLPFANAVHWQTVRKIKKALDPNNIISPGRYCP